jgi:hypothetical protein
MKSIEVYDGSFEKIGLNKFWEASECHLRALPQRLLPLLGLDRIFGKNKEVPVEGVLWLDLGRDPRVFDDSCN